MSEKYEELARAFHKPDDELQCHMLSNTGLRKYIADAFRWYEERREKELKERVMVWLRNEGLITSSRAAEVLETSVSKIIEMSNGETCEWTDDGEGNWDTTCGEFYTLLEGTPSENHCRFCHGCGRRIVEKEGK